MAFLSSLHLILSSFLSDLSFFVFISPSLHQALVPPPFFYNTIYFYCLLSFFNNLLFGIFSLSLQVGVSTRCLCPIRTTRAPVRRAWPCLWSCQPREHSPMGPTRLPHWKEAPPRLGMVQSISFPSEIHVQSTFPLKCLLIFYAEVLVAMRVSCLFSPSFLCVDLFEERTCTILQRPIAARSIE